MKNNIKDTICALASANGIGAIAVIRLSGKKALQIGNQVFSKNLMDMKSHTIHFGYIKDKEPGDPEEPEFTKKILNNSLENQLKGLENKRNKLPFNNETYNSLNQLVKLITSQKVECKRYESNFLHAKAYIFHSKLNKYCTY